VIFYLTGGEYVRLKRIPKLSAAGEQRLAELEATED
jgi:hypothetical protein